MTLSQTVKVIADPGDVTSDYFLDKSLAQSLVELGELRRIDHQMFIIDQEVYEPIKPGTKPGFIARS